MDSLPNEMLFAISDYLSSNDHKTLRIVNPIWQDVATEQLSKQLMPKFHDAEQVKKFCSTFSKKKRTNLCYKFNNFTFGFRLLQSSEAFAPISTFCKYFGTNLTKLYLDLNSLDFFLSRSHRESPIILSKVIGKLLTGVADTVKELRLKNYYELNDDTWTMATFQALENLELVDGNLLEPSADNVDNDEDGDNFIVALSKNVPRICNIQIKDTVGYRQAHTQLLPFLRNVTTSNRNATFDLSFLIINNTNVTTVVEELTSIPGLNVTKLEIRRTEYQIEYRNRLPLPMLLRLFSTLTTLRHLILLGFHKVPNIGDLPSLPNLETLEYYQNPSTTVFPIRARNGYPNLTTVITSYFSNDFQAVIPSVKILKLYDANGHRDYSWLGFGVGDIYETGLETWGNRLAFAFPNINYLSCDIRCIQYKFVFMFKKLKTLKLESLNYFHVQQENDKIETNYYWNLLTRGLKNLTFKEIYKLKPIEGMETHRIQYPVQRPFLGDLKELEVLETITTKPGMPIIKALIYLSQTLELPRLKKLKCTLIPNGDYYRYFGKYVNAVRNPYPTGTVIYKHKTEYLKKFHDKVDLTLMTSSKPPQRPR